MWSWSCLHGRGSKSGSPSTVDKHQ
jgi:hypothetical protein